MTQFKEKSEGQDFVSAGLFTYPVLMAGDILLYQAEIVPIGDDQRQHLELARDIAERFNQRYGETFAIPRGVYPEEGARIKNLQEPERLMSTTRGAPQGVVRMIDEPDVIRKKFKTAVTDSEKEIRHDPEAKPGISNLLEIMSVATGEPVAGARAPLRRLRLRRSSRRTSARRSSTLLGTDPGALPRPPGRRAGAAAPARGRSGEGAPGERADARGDVRAHGLRQGRGGSVVRRSPAPRFVVSRRGLTDFDAAGSPARHPRRRSWPEGSPLRNRKPQPRGNI